MFEGGTKIQSWTSFQSTEIVQSNGQDENQATPDDNDKENALPNDYQQSQLNQTDVRIQKNN